MDKHPLTLTVNGRCHRMAVTHRTTLADALREECGLTGTHVGCGHGVCGSCTVIVDGAGVRACLMFAHQADGCDVRTVEGLAASDGTLHPLQQAFIDHHALQCGFCTPGFLMLITAALEREPEMDDDKLVEVVSSNFCRCTGYGTIVAAARDVFGRAREGADRRA
jgi:aerobic carbon-monoxide dehydrogenase small subunit